MSPKWEGDAYIKIHEGCGGVIRWAEAIEVPGVGYYGKCDGCRQARIDEEEIVPIELGAGRTTVEVANENDRESLADLRWDDSADWDDNQARLQEAVGA